MWGQDTGEAVKCSVWDTESLRCPWDGRMRGALYSPSIESMTSKGGKGGQSPEYRVNSLGLKRFFEQGSDVIKFAVRKATLAR